MQKGGLKEVPAMVEKIQCFVFFLSTDSECDEDENADEAAIATWEWCLLTLNTPPVVQ